MLWSCLRSHITLVSGSSTKFCSQVTISELYCKEPVLLGSFINLSYSWRMEQARKVVHMLVQNQSHTSRMHVRMA